MCPAADPHMFPGRFGEKLKLTVATADIYHDEDVQVRVLLEPEDLRELGPSEPVDIEGGDCEVRLVGRGCAVKGQRIGAPVPYHRVVKSLVAPPFR